MVGKSCNVNNAVEHSLQASLNSMLTMALNAYEEGTVVNSLVVIASMKIWLF